MTRIPQEIVDQAAATDLVQLAGRWGFVAKFPAGESVGPCPGCGGTDRFAINGRENVWRCRQGGGGLVGGGAIALVQHVENVSFRRAVEILTGDLSGLTRREKKDDEKTAEDAAWFREKERRRAFEIWSAARPFDGGGPIAAYLAARGLDAADGLMMPPGQRCRLADPLPYWHHVETGRQMPDGSAEKDWRIIARGPAMVWPIRDLSGRFLGVHCTWIDPDGPKGKADIFRPDTGEQVPAKKVRGSQKGGRIVLRTAAGDADSCAAGEGIESVLSWVRMNPDFDGALLSAVNLGNLAGRAARTVAHPEKLQNRTDGRRIALRVPGPDPLDGEDQQNLFSPDPGTARLVLVADGDSDAFTTQAAMMRARARLADRVPDIAIDWPPAGEDFNSEWMKRNG